MRQVTIDRVLALLVAALAPAAAIAGGPAVVASASASSGLVITSFAVPVGVPVTTLNVPGVLFAYGQPNTTAYAAAQTSAGKCACGQCMCGGKASAKAEAPRVQATAADSPGLAVLRQRCGACHSGGEAKENVRLFDENGDLAADWHDHAQAMFEAVVDRRMPKGGQLTAEEKVQLIEWLVERDEQ